MSSALRSPSLLLPLIRRAARAAAAVALTVVAVACGEDPATKKGPATPQVDPAEHARFEQGKKLLGEATHAINERKYDRARKLLLEVDALKVESLQFQLSETTERLDKREAKLWANEVDEKIKSADCLGAFKELAAPIAKLESDAFTREVRRLVAADAQKGAQAAVDAKVIAAQYADARKLVASAEVKATLGGAAKKMATELEATILDALRGQIAADLKGRKWSAAVDKINAALKRGDATDAHRQALLEDVRAGATPELNTLLSKGVGHRDAKAMLKQAEALIQLVGWGVIGSDAAAAAQGLPEALAKKREALAIWVEAQRAGMKPIRTPEGRWAHGKIAITPPNKLDGPSTRDVPHGARVWVVGTAKDRALVTDSDPGPLPLSQMLHKVIGWAQMRRLAKEDTVNWVVPDDQLKGERVWGPLRPPETVYELGVVMDLAGGNAMVKRYADDRIIKVARRALRSGRLTPGTRVLTFCTAKDQPAQVVEVVAGGRGVKLKCDGGQEKEEVFPSLRSKVEILPPTK